MFQSGVDESMNLAANGWSSMMAWKPWRTILKRRSKTPEPWNSTLMPSYVYVKSEKGHYEEDRYYPGLWTVGFFSPDGQWQAESDHESAEDAANRVHYLNGGSVIE